MSIQNMHYAARIRGVGEKFVNAVKDEDLLGAKNIAETALFLNAGEEVKNSVDGAIQRSAVNNEQPVNEDMMAKGNFPSRPYMGSGIGSAAVNRPQLDPTTVAVMMQMFQQMAAMNDGGMNAGPEADISDYINQHPAGPGVGLQSRLPIPDMNRMMGGMNRMAGGPGAGPMADISNFINQHPAGPGAGLQSRFRSY